MKRILLRQSSGEGAAKLDFGARPEGMTMRNEGLRSLLIALPMACALSADGQYLFSYDLHPCTWLVDARAEALGRANMALPGDLRSLSVNPAGLTELNGIEGYYRHAAPYYLFETSTFTHAAVGCRLTERLAFGFRYDQDSARSDLLVTGDPLGGPVEDVRPAGVFGAAVAYRVANGFSVGAAVANVHPNNKDLAEPHVDISVRQVWEGPRTGLVRSTIRAAAGLENITSAEVDREETLDRGFVFRERYDLPVIVRAGVSANWALHKGWVHDSLPSLALTVQAQFDDELNSRYHTAIRAGAELQVLGMLAVRFGLYSMNIDDQGWPQVQKGALSEATYGFGLILPLATMFAARCPITASFDYCSLPQPAFRKDGLNPFYDEPWERFESWGVRLAWGIGPLIKRSVVPSPSGT